MTAPLFDGPTGTAVRRILTGKLPADLDAVIADCWRCQAQLSGTYWDGGPGCWHTVARLLLDHGLHGDAYITTTDDPQLSMFTETIDAAP